LEENSHIVNVRFAPSPTGLLHIGGARTALFNYLWAKRCGGNFFLRFEDTDKTRSEAIYEEYMLRDLEWLKIHPDGEIIRQTDRNKRHLQILDELKASGVAYPCFCAPNESAGDSKNTRDACRRLSQEERKKLIESGKGHCWRFAAPDTAESFEFKDLLRGVITLDAREVGDIVLARSDGSPTYLFAVVVDDHDASITHVIRGEEHISNTPKQELIYRALGWSAPEWVHIPMILDQERHKLSKRSGAISIASYRDEGWMPEAVAAYLATLSWSGAPSDRLLSPDELAGAFELGSVALDSPIHDPSRMRHFGKLALSSRPIDKLLDDCADLFPMGGDCGKGAERDRGALICELAPGCASIAELRGAITASFSLDAIPPDNGGAVWISDLIPRLEETPSAEWESDRIKDLLKNFQRERGLKGRDFYHALRVSVTGRAEGAPIALLMACLGRDRVIGRINNHRG
jgi:glutamyl-tRNA synthetase